jgi:hypothetical protein
MPGQSRWDGLYLNGCWRAVASAFDASTQARIQIELVEVHEWSFSSEVRRVSKGDRADAQGNNSGSDC